MWFLGLLSCGLLSFLNQFFSYRTEPLIITQITVQVAVLPIGHFLAAVLPTAKFRIPGFGSRLFSLNPSPFNMKEHVLISIFANAGSAFGNGSAYAVMIIDIIKAFYRRKISFFAGWLLIITTQVLGYGWAGLLRKYVVEPAHMWWPSTLVQVSLFRYKGAYRTQEVAIKVLKSECGSSDMQRQFSQEVYIMRKVRHKIVVQFMGDCTKPASLCIVTEYMSGGNVYDYLLKQKCTFRLPSLLKVAILSKGMTYLHQNNIIHR
ncbi:unnamed protein product [Ilex paraguariensis]|uniref:Protein kinase domain-containing protein n=1 Tax=Ilex paraguariensis TaxID=185542 RepID=A0ABC8V2G4_9AQUA